jgi:hypothetical protein
MPLVDGDVWFVHVEPPSVVFLIELAAVAMNPTVGVRKNEANGIENPVVILDHSDAGGVFVGPESLSPQLRNDKRIAETTNERIDDFMESLLLSAPALRVPTLIVESSYKLPPCVRHKTLD